MRKREAIEPRNKLERKPMYSNLQQAAMRTRKRESAQVPSGSKSVASTQGITRVPGRSDGLRYALESVGSSEVVTDRSESRRVVRSRIIS